MTTCLFEATLQHIEKECNCTPKNFIDVVEGFEICAGDQKKCMNENMQVSLFILSSNFLVLLHVLVDKYLAPFDQKGYGRLPHNF